MTEAEFKAAQAAQVARVAAVRDDLRNENEQIRNVLGELVRGIRWWAAQEDGIPEEVAPAFHRAMMLLRWEYSGGVDSESLASEMGGGAVSDDNKPPAWTGDEGVDRGLELLWEAGYRDDAAYIAGKVYRLRAQASETARALDRFKDAYLHAERHVGVLGDREEAVEQQRDVLQAGNTRMAVALRFLRDRYKCRLLPGDVELGDTDEEADRVYEAGHQTDEWVYSLICTALGYIGVKPPCPKRQDAPCWFHVQDGDVRRCVFCQRQQPPQ